MTKVDELRYIELLKKFSKNEEFLELLNRIGLTYQLHVIQAVAEGDIVCYGNPYDMVVYQIKKLYERGGDI